MPLRLIVLGAAAGGGLPQWNCGCANCEGARSGRIAPLTQSSVAVGAGGEAWAVVNASPDIRAQLGATPELHPRGRRDSPIRSVVLTNGDVDHVAGLLTLREGQPFELRATPGILEALAANPVFGVLSDKVRRVETSLEAPFELVPGVEAVLFAVPGKVALWQEGEVVETQLEGEQTAGLELRAGAVRAFVIPGCAAVTPALAERVRGADLLLFDGTVWKDDEMISAGVGAKSGARMGHMAISGPQGTIAAFEGLGIRRKALIHLNNTNPALDPGSPERAEIEAAGWTVTQDGQEFSL